jgi:preprotein translocase subunit SecE
MSTDEKLANDKTDDLDELEAQETALAQSPLAGGPDDEPLSEDDGSHKRTVGVERWVQLGFMVAAILLVWFFDHLISAVWYIFADPNEAIVTAAAVLSGIAAAAVLYSNASAHGLVHGIAEELSKVTWPTRKETSSSTIVVVVTSIVAALMLFLFDSVWSAVTDLVYKV